MSVPLNPALDGNQPPIAPPAPSQQTPPVQNPPETSQVPPVATPGPQYVQMLPEEVQTLRDQARRFHEFEQQRATEAEAARVALQDAEVAKGKAADVITQMRKDAADREKASADRFAGLQQQIGNEKLNATIDAAFIGKSFTGADDAAKAVTARVVSALIRDHLEWTTDAAGAVVVREKITQRPAAEFIREALASPHIQQFFAPKNPPPGIPLNGGLPTSGVGVQAKTPLQLHVEQWKAEQKSTKTLGMQILGTRS